MTLHLGSTGEHDHGEIGSTVKTSLQGTFDGTFLDQTHPMGHYLSAYIDRSLANFELADVDWTTGTVGSPWHTDTFSVAAAPDHSDMPCEVALCGSMRGPQAFDQAQDEVAAHPARRRGRIYWGPFLAETTVGDPPRPSTDLVADVAEAMVGLRSAWAGVTCFLGVYGRASTTPARAPIFTPVDEIWCDNEWDTQRRRGLKATTRVTHSGL